MSIIGFKKQINKVNQYMSEKIGGAKGTELDDEYLEMEKKIDVMGRLVDELMARTHEHLQPNPASRAKLAAVKSISKIRGQSNNQLYPQPEGLLGECMIKNGHELGDDSIFGQSLVDTGEVYKQLADVKYALEDNVKQNFIEPLHHIQTKDLKEVNFHRKKLSGRRLDYDCKRRKQQKGASAEPGAAVPEEDINAAEAKFEESKELAETAMYNVLENDVEQIAALSSFIEAELQFHRQTAELLEELHQKLTERAAEAAKRPKREHVPKRVSSTQRLDGSPTHGSYEFNSHGGSQQLTVPSSHSSYSSSKEDLSQSNKEIQDPFSDLLSVSSNRSSGSSFHSSIFEEPVYSTVDKTKKSLKLVNGKTPTAKALYDFDPENEGELALKEGDIVTLIERIDENWFEGSVKGKVGYFPVNYVDVIVDLP